ncbi:heme-copper oxidase subunit III [Sphingomonas sp. C3-2]|uniref:cytochrome c oxidase subunit 3 n=1 Tax=Sphingomonas sp. C3-2 TaxID=3062169 RepID=UPI00294B3849|nr:heme-copper oxidase subunit III [Sphingomonas sp. C3-2]WOK37695.1 heme-copper oxidase subunit III [Sphingomonas sp. C3-2]
MSLIAALTDKPWESPGLRVAHPVGRATAGTGLGVFLCVVTMLFALLTAAYLLRMGIHGPFGHGDGDWARLPEPPLLWLNTALLIAASGFWLVADRATRRGDINGLRLGLVAGGLLTLGFIVGQLIVWRQLNTSGYFLAVHFAFCADIANPFAMPTGRFMTGNPSVSFFYLITGLHGLHMLGGLGIWGHTLGRAVSGTDAAALRQSVALTARYWHFLLLVWLLMFGLLLMT